MTSVLTLCAALAACAPAKPLETVRGEPPCPGHISGFEAIRIAKEYADRMDVETTGHEVQAIWNDAEWNIFASVSDGSYATLSVSPDGRVMSCDGYHACAIPKETVGVPCKSVAGNLISGEAAVRVASDYLSERGIANDLSGELATWWAAHWAVWFVPAGPAPVDSDFTIFVSPNGSEIELIPALGIPSADGFLFRTPN